MRAVELHGIFILRIMSKTNKLRDIINLIKRVKKSKHKRFVDLRWLLEASGEREDGLVDGLYELCEIGALREEVDGRNKRIYYYLVSEDIDVLSGKSSFETLIEENTQARIPLKASDNKWLDDDDDDGDVGVTQISKDEDSLSTKNDLVSDLSVKKKNLTALNQTFCYESRT